MTRYGHQTYKPVMATVVTHPDRLYRLNYRARQPHPQVARSSTESEDDGDSIADSAGDASDDDDLAGAFLPLLGRGSG